MNKLKEEVWSIFLRYFILLLVAIPNLFLFYFIFTPLTIYPTYFLLNLFYDAVLVNNVILLNLSLPIELIPACIAGSAYYLLLILNLSTPKIKIKKRIKMIAISFLALLILNIFRLFLLSVLAFSNSPLFDLTHKLFWYLISVVFVIGIWIFQIRKYKINEIPLYSDLKFLYKNLTKSFK